MGQQRAIQRLNKGRQHQVLRLLFQVEQKSHAARIIRRKSFLSDHVSLLQDCIDVVRLEFPEILAVVVFAMILGVREGWTFTSTLYFAVMSASTVRLEGIACVMKHLCASYPFVHSFFIAADGLWRLYSTITNRQIVLCLLFPIFGGSLWRSLGTNRQHLYSKEDTRSGNETFAARSDAL